MIAGSLRASPALAKFWQLPVCQVEQWQPARQIGNKSHATKEKEIVEKGHGLIETRACNLITDLEFLHGKEKWANLTSLIEIKSERVINDKTTIETRYYISSLDVSAADFNKYIRMHWGVENSLHWTLDMVFREDEQRKRHGKSAQNFALVNKIALNLLKQNKSKGSLKTKRLRAGWDEQFLLKILKINMR